MAVSPLRCFKPTDDSWYPEYIMTNYQGKKNIKIVEVSFLQLSDKSWRCCVWGADDFGMEFDNPSKDIVFDKFYHLLRKKAVNIKELKELGFVQA